MAALSDTSDTTCRTVIITEGGGQIRYVANHGRIQVIQLRPGGRGQLTTNVDDLDEAERHGRRILEVVQIARAQRLERENA